MKRAARVLIELIHRWFPERQILVRGSGAVRAAHLKQSHQLMAAGAVAVLSLWSVLSPLAFLAVWHGQASATHHAKKLQAELAGAQNTLGTIKAQNNALAAASSEAQVQATQFSTSAAQQLDALDAQTQAAIAQVDGIIHATGLSPKLAPKTPPRPDGNGHAALLQDDLTKLQALSDFLGKIPLAKPVAQMAISSPFGYRPNPWTGAREFHVGIDLRGPVGTPVYATAPGVVSFAGVETGYGELVVLEHGYGLSTRYSHLNKILVHPGEKVTLHQVLGLLGNTGWSTGPHLLYETRFDGEPENPLNFLKVSENDVQD